NARNHALMKREQFTAKLMRMIGVIQSGTLPARVREFYVFGSYSRGALEPGDLDVLVVHDPPPPHYMEVLKKQLEDRSYSFLDQTLKADARFKAEMRRCLRRPGEQVEILLVNKMEEIVSGSSKIRRDDLILLWSESDTDY